MKDGPYEAGWNGSAGEQVDAGYCGGWTVEGPGDGIGYHAWYLNPQNTLASQEEAEKVARLMNLAFREGERKRARDIRGLLE